MNPSPCRIAAVIAAALALILPAAAQSGELQRKLIEESTIEQVVKRGVLRVGMSTFVPWAMTDKTGQLIGFEIDVATRLAKDMGVKVEFVPTKWAGIIPALLTGKFDVIIGGMGILPQRNLKVNFSVPYDHSGVGIVAHRQMAAGFGRLEDFNRPEVIVTARLGSTAAMAADKLLPKAQKRFFDDESQVLQELANGRVHAMLAGIPLPTEQALTQPEKFFLPVAGTITREPIGFALRKGDVDTLNFVDSWIRVVEAEGWLAERKHYWFDTQEWKQLLK
ncbi:MAG: transporter substrate-binding domain-containing protein [Desulfobacterales bacterium]|jgi:polar amino acid transport system substrate-binding protein|nr:transporter substrate-binding domain-containing protein [Desulfobacterales bacterium]